MKQLPNSTQRMPRRMLLVDDEPHIISAIKRQLRHSGIRILSAASGEEGLAALAKERVELILTGQRMAGMGGLEFLRIARRLYPDTVRIVLTGFAEKLAVSAAIEEGTVHRFLTKPWDDGVLHACIEDAFARGPGQDAERRRRFQPRPAATGG